LRRTGTFLRTPANQGHTGAYPKELLALGIREYREIFFKPYRVIYRVLGNVVHVFLIADGRRDMQTLLQRRLLDA
jgi:toxin ParE1/3/4